MSFPLRFRLHRGIQEVSTDRKYRDICKWFILTEMMRCYSMVRHMWTQIPDLLCLCTRSVELVVTSAQRIRFGYLHSDPGLHCSARLIKTNERLAADSWARLLTRVNISETKSDISANPRWVFARMRYFKALRYAKWTQVLYQALDKIACLKLSSKIV